MKKPNIENVEDMPIYQSCFHLATEIEKISRAFDSDFRWLRGQVLRSSESVCANMTEGFYSQYSTEYLQALYRCRREGRETKTHLCYAMSVKQLPEAAGRLLTTGYDEALKQLANLIASIERKIRHRGKGKAEPESRSS
ncbi:MAG: four helix bundle protein [Nitrospirae bacterium]|jgi:four helix bundle protein|nr:four helix bundle protein [Nitrospirota bacterium]